MNAPAKCPGCGTALEPDCESCPNCPMSFTDGPPQKSALQNDTLQSWGPPVLLIGGMGFFIWTFGQYMWRTAEGGGESAAAALKPVIAAPASKGGGVVPVDSRAIQGMVNEQVTGAYDASGAAPEPPKTEEEEGPGAISIMAEKEPKAVTEWKLRGVIYDLLTLKPVPGVSMTFTDNETNSRAVVLTDGQGRYRTILPPLSGRGYLVTMSKTGYEKTYLNPGTEGVSEMPLDRRKELVKELGALIAEPASLQPDSERPLVTNFHLPPK